MEIWGQILIAVVPAIISGLVAYYKATSNAKVEIHRVEKNAEIEIIRIEKEYEGKVKNYKKKGKQIWIIIKANLKQIISKQKTII